MQTFELTEIDRDTILEAVREYEARHRRASELVSNIDAKRNHVACAQAAARVTAKLAVIRRDQEVDYVIIK